MTTTMIVCYVVLGVVIGLCTFFIVDTTRMKEKKLAQEIVKPVLKSDKFAITLFTLRKMKSPENELKLGESNSNSAMLYIGIPPNRIALCSDNPAFEALVRSINTFIANNRIAIIDDAIKETKAGLSDEFNNMRSIIESEE